MAVGGPIFAQRRCAIAPADSGLRSRFAVSVTCPFTAFLVIRI